jgi:hypothetical protein
MNEQNMQFLKERLFFLGFGDKLNADLEKKIGQQQEKFNLDIQGEFESKGKKNIVDYVLDFSKSKQNDMYFVNNYTATIKGDDPEKERSQKFYLNNGSGVTAKEAFNLLEGRAVLKNNLVNKNEEKYKAWLQLNLNEKDDKGNHRVHQYHEAWRYDLEKNLGKHPIKELSNATQKEQLIKSLEKGNAQQVTFVRDDKEEKMFLEANPKDRNLIVYDEKMNKQFQGIKQPGPEVKEGQAKQNAPVEKTTDAPSQDVGGRGADAKEQSKAEKLGKEIAPSERTRPKRRGMSV